MTCVNIPFGLQETSGDDGAIFSRRVGGKTAAPITFVLAAQMAAAGIEDFCAFYGVGRVSRVVA